MPEARAKFAAELATLGITPGNRARWRVLGVFGTLHPGHDHAAFVAEQVKLAGGAGQQLALLTIGRTGPDATTLLADLARQNWPGFIAHQFGERSAAEVSGFLQNLDFGVAAAPSPLLGKSSAVAAMRLHGLRVLVPHRLPFPAYEAELGPDPDATTLDRAQDSFSPAATAQLLLSDLARHSGGEFDL